MNDPTISDPYAAPSAHATQSRPQGVAQPGWALVLFAGLGALMAFYNLVFWGLILFDANPVYPLERAEGMVNYQLAVALLMLMQSTLMLVGGQRMLSGRGRQWVMIGACAAIAPPAGVCLFPAIAGIWTLGVLRRTEVKEWFARTTP